MKLQFHLHECPECGADYHPLGEFCGRCGSTKPKVLKEKAGPCEAFQINELRRRAKKTPPPAESPAPIETGEEA